MVVAPQRPNIGLLSIEFGARMDVDWAIGASTEAGVHVVIDQRVIGWAIVVWSRGAHGRPCGGHAQQQTYAASVIVHSTY